MLQPLVTVYTDCESKTRHLMCHYVTLYLW